MGAGGREPVSAVPLGSRSESTAARVVVELRVADAQRVFPTAPIPPIALGGGCRAPRNPRPRSRLQLQFLRPGAGGVEPRRESAVMRSAGLRGRLSRRQLQVVQGLVATVRGPPSTRQSVRLSHARPYQLRQKLF